MSAGLNIRSNIWRVTQGTDDLVGGAVITGTVVYENVLTRLEAQPEQQLLLQQGLETVRTFTAVVVPGTMVIKERDELEVIAPFDHPYYGDRFRIVSMRYSTHNPRDPRNYVMLSLIRSVRAHSLQ
jgi:hypothetical protein